jgi:hypothetical protein
MGKYTEDDFIRQLQDAFACERHELRFNSSKRALVRVTSWEGEAYLVEAAPMALLILCSHQESHGSCSPQSQNFEN